MNDPQVELRNRTTGSAWIPASGLPKILILGALHGHHSDIRASGPRATETLQALLALAARGFDETPPPEGDEVIASPVHGEPITSVTTGRSPLPASLGVGIGPARPAVGAHRGGSGTLGVVPRPDNPEPLTALLGGRRA